MMSDEEIAEEAGFIKNSDAWPLWPVLPVKNIRRGSKGHPADEEIGLMLAEEGPKVYLKNMLELEGGLIHPQLRDARVLEFSSMEELVKAGWIGD